MSDLEEKVLKNKENKIDKLINNFRAELKKFNADEEVLIKDVGMENERLLYEFKNDRIRRLKGIRRNLLIAEEWKKQYPDEDIPVSLFLIPLSEAGTPVLKKSGSSTQFPLDPVVKTFPYSISSECSRIQDSELTKEMKIDTLRDENCFFNIDRYKESLQVKSDGISWGYYPFDRSPDRFPGSDGLYIYVSIPTIGMVSQTAVDLRFTTNIDISEKGLYGLEILSKATVCPGTSPFYLDESPQALGPDFCGTVNHPEVHSGGCKDRLLGVNLDGSPRTPYTLGQTSHWHVGTPITSARFTVYHDVEVIWKNFFGLGQRTLSAPQYLPGGGIWQSVEATSYNYGPGSTPYPCNFCWGEHITDKYLMAYYFMEVEHTAEKTEIWAPYHWFGRAQTKCDIKISYQDIPFNIPIIENFNGPCKIQVIETIRYKFTIISSQLGKGDWALITCGLLTPLEWKLYKFGLVKSDPRPITPSKDWLESHLEQNKAVRKAPE
ncbi:MAG: hypothetical protein ACFFD2_21175 [Promethearchaeota archaeon]